MNKVNAIKWSGLIGALLTGGVLIVSKQPTEGVGVILAALSSAGVFEGSK